MSIPPLVCSTPPPLDQCEDDKDPEDFDLRYNLSQDEDEDEDGHDFDYGNFTSYNHYQNHTSTKKQIDISADDHNSKKFKSENISEENTQKSTYTNNDNTSQTVNREEELHRKVDDFSIEDLNLKINDELLVSNSKKNVKEKDNIIETDIPLNTAVFNISSTNDENNDSPKSNYDQMDDSMNRNMSEDDTKNMPMTTTQNEVFTELSNDKVCHSICDENSKDDNIDSISDFTDVINSSKDPPFLPVEDEDDFGDFDNFRPPDNEVTSKIMSEQFENPWGSIETSDTAFSDFTANFKSDESNSQQSSEIETINIPKIDITQNEVLPNITQEDDDDDFGDFDDFQSSVVTNKINEEREESVTSELLPVFNLHASDSESHLIESINKALSSIFEEEISECDEKFEGDLELLLSETWRHLLETDVRQPYIINWNSSLGQKTLLKALCIDSRNILFGPKWSNNMPKYAANLSTAPLQPQKHVTPSTSQNESVNTEKTTAKPSTWSDPFTTDGQESCNTENENVVMETTLPNMDAFEDPVADKVYPSSLNIPPLRQINLPDTHIFTPTDSETPRSKTIHYDSPAVLLPQPARDTYESHLEEITKQTITSVEASDTDINNDYWEFQDFKSVPVSTTVSSDVSNQPKISLDIKSQEIEDASTSTLQNMVPFQTQLLQPVKMEPVIPSLNWPEPGEVKNTSEDFSDFVSSWNKDKQELGNISQLTNNTSVFDHTSNKANDTVKNGKSPSVNSNNSENFDDFDTFQSALPQSKSIDSVSSSKNAIIPITTEDPSSSSNINIDFDSVFPKMDSFKANIISSSLSRPNVVLTSNISSVSNGPEHNNVSPGPSSQLNILQPIPASNIPRTQNQQKTGQILQPLSLESYSQINWPSPGIDLQDLSRFNPVETLQSLKCDLSVGGTNKSSPIHSQKHAANSQSLDDDVWGEFVSSVPKQSSQPLPRKLPTFADDDEWTDFVSSPSVKPANGLNTISLNVHTLSNMQKVANQSKINMKSNQMSLDIPTLNYITPKSNTHQSYTEKHFQNL